MKTKDRKRKRSTGRQVDETHPTDTQTAAAVVDQELQTADPMQPSSLSDLICKTAIESSTLFGSPTTIVNTTLPSLRSLAEKDWINSKINDEYKTVKNLPPPNKRQAVAGPISFSTPANVAGNGISSSSHSIVEYKGASGIKERLQSSALVNFLASSLPIFPPLFLTEKTGYQISSTGKPTLACSMEADASHCGSRGRRSLRCC